MYKNGIRKISQLIPYVNNSRTHSEDQVKQLASSIKEFGFTNPVLVDEENGLIAGHGRIAAAQLLGMEDVPVVIIKGLSDAQKKALVIADNKLALNAGWDFEALRLEIETLDELDFDLDILGFDENELGMIRFDEDSEGELPDLAEGDNEPFQKKTFVLHDEQVQLIDDAVTLARTNPLSDTGINENSNGNALALICQQWLEAQNG